MSDLHTLHLQAAHSEISSAFVDLLDAPHLLDLSLELPWASQVRAGKERDRFYKTVSTSWPALHVLRLPQLVRDSNLSSLFQNVDAVEVLECTADVLSILSSDPDLLPKLSTLRILPAGRLSADGCFKVLCELLEERDAAELPIRQLLFHDGRDLARRLWAEQSVRDMGVKLGWFEMWDGFRELKEDLEPVWGLYTEEQLRGAGSAE
jgi:hypothetical protein